MRHPRTPHPERWLLVLLALLPLASGAADYTLDAENGQRVTIAGDELDYLLLVPRPITGEGEPPYPTLLLTHGFARDFGRMELAATTLAAQGLIVMTPNTAPMGGIAVDRRRVVRNTADHLRWLLARSEDPADPLYRLVDRNRLALAGHSAGGAVSVEAALLLQAEGIAPRALVLLDAVPYSATIDGAKDLTPLPLLSLRAEPSSCNADDAVGGLVDALPFPVTDLRILGATHCDPEGPTDITCRLACRIGTPGAAASFRDLMGLFLAEAIQDKPSRFHSLVRTLARGGAIEILSLPER